MYFIQYVNGCRDRVGIWFAIVAFETFIDWAVNWDPIEESPLLCIEYSKSYSNVLNFKQTNVQHSGVRWQKTHCYNYKSFLINTQPEQSSGSQKEKSTLRMEVLHAFQLFAASFYIFFFVFFFVCFLFVLCHRQRQQWKEASLSFWFETETGFGGGMVGEEGGRWVFGMAPKS